jgi:hypothetical protein
LFWISRYRIVIISSGPLSVTQWAHRLPVRRYIHRQGIAALPGWDVVREHRHLWAEKRCHRKTRALCQDRGIAEVSGR